MLLINIQRTQIPGLKTTLFLLLGLLWIVPAGLYAQGCNANFTYTITGCNSVSFLPDTLNTSFTYSWDFGDGNTSNTPNPVHNLTSYGAGKKTFIVQLTVSSTTCASATVSKDIVVDQVPDAAIEDKLGNKFVSCTNGVLTILNTSFTKASNTLYNIEWGDGSTPLITPTFSELTNEYYENKLYYLKLTVTGSNGCISKDTISFIYSAIPNIGVGLKSSLPICLPGDVRLDISGVTENTPNTIYEVVANDGSKKLVFNHPPPATIFHRFDSIACGTNSTINSKEYFDAFKVSITAYTGCPNQSATASVGPIRTVTPPKASFEVTPGLEACQSEVFKIKNTSKSGLFWESTPDDCTNKMRVAWSITPSMGYTVSSGSLTDSAGLSLTFQVPGTYSIRLIVENKITTHPINSDPSCAADTLIKTICVLPVPVSKFIKASSGGCVPLINKFTNMSYTLGSCGDATYEWTVAFTPSDCGATESYTFLNNTNKNSISPDIRFDAPGAYSISLTVTNKCGTHTYTDTLIVSGTVISSINPIADSCGQVRVQPTLTSTSLCPGTPPTYIWTFPAPNEGTYTGAQPPVLTYSVPGTYTIKLQIQECSNTEMTETFTVLPIPKLPAISANTSCPGSNLIFTNPDTVGVTCLWTGPNGFISNDCAPVIPDVSAANAGEYCLTVTNPSNCSVKTCITVSLFDKPTIKVAQDTTHICIGQSAALSATGGVTYAWTPAINMFPATGVGVSISVKPPVGTWFYVVQGTNATNCSSQDTAIVVVREFPTASIIKPGVVCTGKTLTLAGQGSVKGAGTWSTASPAIVSAAGIFSAGQKGKFPVFYSFIDQYGCQAPVVIDTVCVIQAPTAAFNASSLKGCIPFEVQFNNNSSTVNECEAATYKWTVQFNAVECAPASGKWSFISGTDTYFQPEFRFDSIGQYVVTLTVTNACGTQSASQTVEVGGVPRPVIQPISDFCGPSTLIPKGTIKSCNATINEYNWLFEGGTPASSTAETPPPVAFSALGSHVVSLSVKNTCGTSVVKDTFSILQRPAVAFNLGKEKACKGEALTPTNTSTGTNLGYKWSAFGPGRVQFSNVTAAQPSLTFPDTGMYIITLSVGNTDCDTIRVTDTILISQSPTVQLDTIQDACGGVTLKPSATYSDTSRIYRVVWSFPAAASIQSSTVYDPGLVTIDQSGSHQIKIRVENVCGIAVDSSDFRVLEAPIVNFQLDTSFAYKTDTVGIKNSSRGDDLIYAWSATGSGVNFEGGDTIESPRIAFSDTGMYVVTLQLSSSVCPGESMSDTILIFEKPTLNCRTNDSLELVKLYHTTNGANWTRKWDLSTPVDTWSGVLRTTDGCVVHIDLYENGLVGTLPDFNLPNLQSLYLGVNRLTGSIPNFSLPNLRNLSLWTNELTGTIPDFNLPNLQELSLGVNRLTGSIPNFNLPNLQHLSLWGNELTGTIPDFNLPNLQGLDLSRNQLTGTIPDFDLPSLQSLSLGINRLTGSIPNFNLPNLQYLSLWINELTGTIPDFNLPNLQGLNLSRNQLTGTIPNFNLPNLQGIDLSDNQLTGTIPDFTPSLQELSLGGNQLTGSIPNFNLPNLQALGLGGNQLTGTIPNFNLPNLRFLALWTNELTGTIPDFNLPNLQAIDLSNNELTDTIPDFNLPNLQALTLSSNQLTGTIPNFNLPNLQYLFLQTNQLTGTIPDLKLSNLYYVDLSNNQLSGRVPRFEESPSLYQLRLDNNELTEIPVMALAPSSPRLDSLYKEDEYGIADKYDHTSSRSAQLDRLPGSVNTGGILSVTFNRLTFDDLLPNIILAANRQYSFSYTPQKKIYPDTTFEVLPGSTFTLDLGIDSALTDNIYYWEKDGVPFDTIIGDNRLVLEDVGDADYGSYVVRVQQAGVPNLTLESGAIQLFPTVENCRTNDSLELVKLYHATNGANWIRKWDLSTPFSTWSGLSVNTNGCVTRIDLSYGGLSGSIPDLNLPNLQELSLGTNQLTGVIPNLRLTNLRYLRLSDNQLTGTIPDFNLPNLETLHLANNQLTGTIPDFNLPNLIYLYLFDNQLSGTIPNFNLPNLQKILLFSNQLTGTIPDFNLLNLQELSLGTNKLTGSIPDFNLPNLETLHLANNQLTGTIPDFNLSHLIYLYLFNNQLSGTIPNFNLPNLQKLLLVSNQLTGSIPDFNQPSLQELSLGTNQLTGVIPDLKLPDLRNLDLSNNQFSGQVPDFAESPYLSRLNLRNNQLTDLPDLSNLAERARSVSTTATLEVYSNRLTFEDLIPNIGLLEEDIFNYIPQKAIFSDTVLVASPGDTLVFDLGIDAEVADNTYVWKKDGEPYRTVVGNNKLIFNSIRESDSGAYSVEVRNARVPDLVLYGGNLHIEVDCPDNPMAHIKSQSDTICLGAEYVFWVDLGADRQLWDIRYSINGVEYEVFNYISGTLLRTALSADAEIKLLYASLPNGCEAPIGNDLLSVRVQRFSGVLSADQSVICIGGTANLSVTGVLPGSRIIWERSLDSLFWQDIAGATASTLRVTSTEEGLFYYRVRVEQGRCTFSTNGLKIDVKPGLDIPVIMGPGKLCVGDSVDLYAGEYFGYPKVSYRWQTSVNNSTFTDIAANSGEWLRVTRGTAGITYYRVSVSISGSGCATKTSPSHTLTAVARPGITVSTGQSEVCVGTGIGLSGSFVPLTTGSYQWQESPDSLEWTDIKGAVSSSYTVVRQEAGTRFYRLVGSVADAQCAIISRGYRLSWITQPQVALVYGDTTVCSGGKLLLKTQVVGTTTPSYVWQSSTNRTTWTTITGATQGSYTATAGTVGSVQHFRVQMNPGKTGCGVVTSEVVGMRVVGKLSVVLEADTGLVCSGGNVELRVRSQGGVGQNSYIWQQSQNRLTWRGIGTGTDSTLNISGATGVNYYRAVVSSSGSGCGTNLSSNQVSVNGVSKAILGLRADAEKVCESGEVRLNATWGSGIVGGQYVWERSIDGSSWEILEATQTASARFTAGLSGASYYRVRGFPVTRGCEEDTSDMLKIQVIGLPVLDITGTPESGACIGGVVTLNTAVTGGSITSYTWQVSSDGSRWNTITGAKGSSYRVPTSAAGIRYYRVSGGSSCGAVTSKASMVSVNAGVRISGTPSLAEECTGGSVELSLNITGGSGQRQIQWMRSRSAAFGYSKMAGENSGQLSIDSIWSGNTYYQVEVSDAGIGCGTGLRLTTPILVKGLANPVVRVTGPTGVVCTGQSATLRAVVSGGKGSALYQWERSADGTNWEGIANGGNTAQYFVNTADTGSYYYRVYVWMSEGSCADAFAAPYRVSVAPGGTLDLSSAVDTVCLGGTIQLSASVSAGTQVTSYQWQYQDIGSTVWNTLTGYTGSSISLISNTSIIRRFRVQGIISSACGPIISDTAVVVTVGKPVVRVSGPLTGVCKGSIVKLTAQVVGGAGIITYQWQEAAAGTSTWRNITGATESSYQPGTSTAGIKRYRVFVRASGVGCGTGVYSVNTIAVTVLGSCTVSQDVPGLLPGIAPVEQTSDKRNGLPWIALLQLRELSRTRTAPQLGVPVANELVLNTASPALPVEQKSQEVLLYQNHPNPFSDITRIGYYLPHGMDIRIVVEDIRGRQLYQEEGYKESGTHELTLDRSKFRGSGVYIYRLETRTGGLVRKMLLVE